MGGGGQLIPTTGHRESCTPDQQRVQEKEAEAALPNAPT